MTDYAEDFAIRVCREEPAQFGTRAVGADAKQPRGCLVPASPGSALPAPDRCNSQIRHAPEKDIRDRLR